MKRAARILALLLSPLTAWACQCPVTQLSLQECNKYELIFRGTIQKVVPCRDKFGEAVFLVEELFRGNATRNFTVLFDCGEECAQELHAGQEWIIYTRYKQVDNAKLDWCSRSRKHFKNEKEDFYTVNYGNDFFDELNFLRSNLGQHRLLAEKQRTAENRNKLPDNNQSILLLLVSIAFIVVFYIIFRRWFR